MATSIVWDEGESRGLVLGVGRRGCAILVRYRPTLEAAWRVGLSPRIHDLRDEFDRGLLVEVPAGRDAREVDLRMLGRFLEHAPIIVVCGDPDEIDGTLVEPAIAFVRGDRLVVAVSRQARPLAGADLTIVVDPWESCEDAAIRCLLDPMTRIGLHGWDSRDVRTLLAVEPALGRMSIGRARGARRASRAAVAVLAAMATESERRGCFVTIRCGPDLRLRELDELYALLEDGLGAIYVQAFIEPDFADGSLVVDVCSLVGINAGLSGPL